MQQAQLLRREGRRAELLASLKALANRIPVQANLLVEMAADELALGDLASAGELNEHALKLDPTNLSALLQHVHLAILREDWGACGRYLPQSNSCAPFSKLAAT